MKLGKMLVTAFVGLIVVMVVSGCSYMEERRAERLGEPVLLEDGGVRLYRKGGVIELEGIAEAVFPEDAFEEATVVRLAPLDNDAAREIAGDLAGYVVALEIEGESDPLKPYELTINRAPDTLVLGIFEDGTMVYEGLVTETKAGTFAVIPAEVLGAVEELPDSETVEAVTDEETEGRSEVLTASPGEEIREVEVTEVPDAAEISVDTDDGITDVMPVDGNQDLALSEEPGGIAPEISADGETDKNPMEGFTGIVQIAGDGTGLYLYNPETGEGYDGRGPEAMLAGGLHPTEEVVMTYRDGRLMAEYFKHNEQVEVLAGEGLEFVSLLWSEDGATLAIALRDAGGNKNGLWLFDMASASLTQLSKGNIRTMGWSADGSRLIFAEKNPNGDEGYQLIVKTGDLQGNISIVYGLIAQDGDAVVTNAYSSQTGDKAYATASITDPDLGSFTIGLIYDFTSGAYRPVMSSAELYSAYMGNFDLVPELVDRYGQLATWVMPEVRRIGNDVMVTYDGHCRYYSGGDPLSEIILDGSISSTWVDW